MNTTSRYGTPLWLLALGVLVPAALRAQEGKPLFTTDFPPEEFAARRAAVYDAIGPEAVAVVQGAPMPIGFVPFRQTNEFYYLCGIESPHAYLVLDGRTRRTTVYLPNRNERREFSEGKVLSAEDDTLVRRLSGVDEVRSTARLVEDLRRIAASPGIRSVYAPHAPPEGISTTRNMAHRTFADIASDPLDGGMPRHERFLEQLQRHTAPARLEDLTPILDRLRVIKSPRELEMIRIASRLQGLAILEAMRSTQPGVTEYEITAVGKFIFYRHGAQGDAYYPLVHSGRNAYFNHFHAGQRTVEDGDLVLFDYSPDYRYYVSDMARMWPANGRFSPVQRELYGFYKEFYEAILRSIRPGITMQQVKRDALVRIDSLLARTRFSKPTYAAAAREFVEAYRRSAGDPNTRLGHWVGMAAHDPGIDPGVLRPGLVFVIEPQFRVPEERIYIRLEDVIAITEDGVEIMTDFVPRDMDAIERIMREPGLLQQQPELLRSHRRETRAALDAGGER